MAFVWSVENLVQWFGFMPQFSSPKVAEAEFLVGRETCSFCEVQTPLHQYTPP
eukprot:m.226781 g.226781  ORF g.226781 m.226781 type:complete len:53 (+) comp33501_c7_seq3:715-873(+)